MLEDNTEYLVKEARTECPRNPDCHLMEWRDEGVGYTERGSHGMIDTDMGAYCREEYNPDETDPMWMCPRLLALRDEEERDELP